MYQWREEDLFCTAASCQISS